MANNRLVPEVTLSAKVSNKNKNNRKKNLKKKTYCLKRTNSIVVELWEQ